MSDAPDAVDAPNAAPQPRPPDAPATELTLRFWGVRGSVPAPGAATARYGGNTSCVELRTGDGRRLVLDAGTGLRALGEAIAAEGMENVPELAIAVTHPHADHVQGLPFFLPLSRGSGTVTLYAAEPQVAGVEAATLALLRPPLFPHADGMIRRLRVRSVAGGAEVAGFTVQPIAVSHPGGASGFRIGCAAARRSVAYIPDNELAALDAEGDARRELLEAIAGVDVLIHDATYLPAELAAYRGWGHSSYAEALRLAADARVGRLVLFHHSPARDDAALDLMGAVARAATGASGDGPEIVVAAEGDSLTV